MSVAPPPRPPPIVLSGAKPNAAVRGVERASLTDKEQADLRRLVELVDAPGQELVVAAKSRLVIGSLTLRDRAISVAPPLPPTSFVTMLVTSVAPEFLGKKFATEEETAMSFDPSGDPRYFETLLAVLCIAWTERILSTHIAQAYVRRSERLETLRGRVQWSRNFGHHPVEGVSCQYFIKVTDNLWNRLVLASLKKCALVLRDTQWSARANRQVFMWRSLASSHIPKRLDFKIAYSKQTRQTQHYVPALRLGHALLFGHAPRSMTPEGSGWLQGTYLFMDRIYEDFLVELLQRALGGTDLTVSKQVRQRDAFTNDLGRRYLEARPDIVISREGEALAVVDAKYKPKYMRGGPGVPQSLDYRVSAEDLYQMFFYEARLRFKNRSSAPLKAAVVAPQLSGDQPVDRPYRRITANAADEDQAARVEVLPLPLEPVLEHVKEGRFQAALSEAPELQEFLQDLLSPNL